MTHTYRIPSMLSGLMILVLLLSACQPAAKALPSPTALPPTASATPAPTATPTEIPTPTATPQPTPLPAGYHALDWAGFSFTAPESWEVVVEDSQVLVLEDPNDRNFYMLVFTDFEDEELTIDELAGSIVQFFEGDSATDFTNTDPVDIEIKGAQSAQMSEITRGTGVKKTDYRFYWVHNTSRYIGLVFGMKESSLEKKKVTLERVFDSIQVAAPRPNGLDRAETLYQIAMEPDPEDLDPAVSTSSAGDFTGLLFSGLVRLTPGLQIEPDLAESWQVSEDGSVYTFKIRSDAKFANGNPITAQIVADSWERATDPDLDSTTARTYLGDIQGVEEKLKGKAETISGLEVLDARTLQVKLLGPRPYFLAKLTYPTAMVVDTVQASPTNSDWVWTANSSGPFTISDYQEGEALIFERNPNYYKPAGVRYLLYSLVWGGSPKSLFEDGELDLLPIGSDDVLQVNKADDPSHDLLVSVPSMCTTLLQINPDNAPTDDPKVREALALAIDRDELNEVLSNGLAMPAGTILPPAMPGYSADLDQIRFDAEAARKALEDSTYNGKPITLKVTVSGYAGEENPLVSALAEMWKQNLGIDVQMEALDPTDFSRAARENPGNIVSYGWCADYPDPENFLDLLYHTGGDFNVAAYSNAEVDALLEKARIEPDVQQRLALYHQVEEKLLSEYVSLPLFHGISHVLISARVQNYQEAPVGVQQLQNVTLKP